MSCGNPSEWCCQLLRVGLAAALAIGLAACGGRASHPVAPTSPLDARLSCDHLRAERSVNDRRIADLLGEQSQDRTNNAAWIVATPVMLPVFLDLSDSEKKEIAALQERNRALDEMIAERCPNPPVSGDAPPARQP